MYFCEMIINVEDVDGSSEKNGVFVGQGETKAKAKNNAKKKATEYIKRLSGAKKKEFKEALKNPYFEIQTKEQYEKDAAACKESMDFWSGLAAQSIASGWIPTRHGNTLFFE